MLTDSQKDYCAGLALLWMGPDGDPEEEYTKRMMLALMYEDAEECEHVSALMLCQLPIRGVELSRELKDRWGIEWGHR